MTSFCLRHVLSLLHEEDMAFSLFDDGDNVLVWIDGTYRSFLLSAALERYPLYAKKKLSFRLCYLEEGESLPIEAQEKYRSLGLSLTTIPCSYVLSTLETHGKSKETSSSLRRHLELQAALMHLSHIRGQKLLLLSTLKDAENAYFKHQQDAHLGLQKPKEAIKNKTIIRPFLFCPESLMNHWEQEKEEESSYFLQPLSLSIEEEKMDLYRQTTEEQFPSFQKQFISQMKEGAFAREGVHPCYVSLLDPSFSYWPILTAEDMRCTSFSSRQRKDGEHDFILLQKQKKVGEFAYVLQTKHRIEFFGLKGPKSLQKLMIQEGVIRFSKKIKPAHFVLSGTKKDIALESGFERKIGWGQSRPHYEKKTN